MKKRSIEDEIIVKLLDYPYLKMNGEIAAFCYADYGQELPDIPDFDYVFTARDTGIFVWFKESDYWIYYGALCRGTVREILKHGGIINEQ